MDGEEEYTMAINPDMLEAAQQLLKEGAVLPYQLPGFRHMFLAEAGDSTISAIGGFVHEGRSYKIGTRKDSQHA